jgi:hypothetical protein
MQLGSVKDGRSFARTIIYGVSRGRAKPLSPSAISGGTLGLSQDSGMTLAPGNKDDNVAEALTHS